MKLPFAPIALLVAVVIGGCGADDNPRLLSQADADALLERVDEAASAARADRCDAAREALREASDQVGSLPERTSVGLRRNLDEWITHLRSELPDACEEDEEEEETATPEPTPTETAEPTATPTATAEPTATPTPTPTATEEPGSGTGGSPPSGEDG